MDDASIKLRQIHKPNAQLGLIDKPMNTMLLNSWPILPTNHRQGISPLTLYFPQYTSIATLLHNAYSDKNIK